MNYYFQCDGFTYRGYAITPEAQVPVFRTDQAAQMWRRISVQRTSPSEPLALRGKCVNYEYFDLPIRFAINIASYTTPTWTSDDLRQGLQYLASDMHGDQHNAEFFQIDMTYQHQMRTGVQGVAHLRANQVTGPLIRLRTVLGIMEISLQEDALPPSALSAVIRDFQARSAQDLDREIPQVKASLDFEGTVMTYQVEYDEPFQDPFRYRDLLRILQQMQSEFESQGQRSIAFSARVKSGDTTVLEVHFRPECTLVEMGSKAINSSAQ